jgi:hypothetical protein
MLNLSLAARLPDRLRFTRNGREAEANRIRLGEVEVIHSRIKLADAAYHEEMPTLRIRVPNGRWAVHVYQWNHAAGSFNVCAVISFARQRLALSRTLTIPNEIRPDMTAGMMVDSGEIWVGDESGLTFPAGLGDGYYPVVGLFNYGLFLQAIVIDLKAWHVPRVILQPGQVMDEFGMVRIVNQDSGSQP